MLLVFGGIYSGVLTYTFGRIVYGPLWQRVRGSLPKARFQAVELFSLFIVLQVTLTLTQLIWPVVAPTNCVITTLPQTLEALLTPATFVVQAVSPSQITNTKIADRAISAAAPCGIAIMCWLVGNLLIQANHIERRIDRLIVLLFVAPLGTFCVAIVTSIVGVFGVQIFILGGPLPQIDSTLWHGVVLFIGGGLGVIYCRMVGAWIVGRAPIV